MRFTFLGSGTSTGVPVIGCGCAICASDNPKNKRLRVAGMLSWDEFNVVIDTGPDFRQQMLRHRITDLHAVLLTHSHVDHLYGLDDIRIFCYRAGGRIPIFGERAVLDRVMHVFDYAFQAKAEGGGVPQLELNEIRIGEPFKVLGREVMPLRVWHGSTPVTSFRLGNFAYVTDTNRVPDETLEGLQGLDTLILDALRERRHSTHFSIEEAVEVAQRLEAKRTYFIHMTHDVDHDSVNAALPDNIHLAFDGLELDL
ncbi:MAG: MBL fold metallo-hydrolase [Candidatus Poribacteria bacterium]|nr:MBL fold metallo-hydrolase [Candidatus Poribacteria bacterium]